MSKRKLFKVALIKPELAPGTENYDPKKSRRRLFQSFLKFLPIWWPEPDESRDLMALCFLYAIAFGLVYAGADAISHGADHRWSVVFDFESQIPFRPEFSILYLSIVPLLMLAPTIFPTARDLLPLFVTLCVELIVAAVIFVLLPIENSFSHEQTGGSFALFFAIADTVNLTYNDLPSLHVALTTTAWYAFSQRLSKVGRILLAVWGTLIILSTVLIHAHHVLDVLAGVLLAAFALGFVYRPLSKSAVKDRLFVEWICLLEFARMSRRHRRYFIIFGLLYQRSLVSWKRLGALRTGFCLLQAVDDYLDGDRGCGTDPVAIATNIAVQFETGRFQSDRLSRLAAAFFQDIYRCAFDPDLARREVVGLIRHMIGDHERMSRRSILTERKLRDHHRTTFRYSLNLFLNASGSPVRSDSFVELLDALGWCSTMRDLREDLQKGIINIPSEVLSSSEDVATSASYERIVELERVREWMKSELRLAHDNLATSSRKVQMINDKKAQRIFSMFLISMRRFARRLGGRNSFGLEPG